MFCNIEIISECMHKMKNKIKQQNVTRLTSKIGNKMEQTQQKSEEMEVAETNKESLCIVHMKDSNLQNFTFISDTKDKDGIFQRIKKLVT